MLTSTSWFTKSYLRYVGILLLITVTACGSRDTSISSQNNGTPGITIPQAIATVLPSNGALSAYVRIDGGARHKMSISGDKASVSLNGISIGSHTLTIEFEFVFDNKPSSPLMLASATKTIVVTTGDNGLDFSGTEYDSSKYDSDNDGIPNLQELADNTNPFAGIKVTGVKNDTSESGATANFTVVLTTQPTADVSITLYSNNTGEGELIDSANGSAVLATQTLTFTSQDWDQPQTVTVKGVDDTFVDGPVVYSIVTDPAASADTDYNNMDPADVSITNDDNEKPPQITLSFAPTAINEDNGTAQPAYNTATLTATTDVVSTNDIKVDLDFSNSTATLDTDYSTSSKTITILPGDKTGTATITTIPDTLYEGNESIVAAIASISNGVDKGGPATLTITENDALPLVNLSIDHSSITEDQTLTPTALITASLVDASGKPITAGVPVTVNLNITNDFPPGVPDYTVGTTSIVIPAGSTTRSTDNANPPNAATITANEDSKVEKTENITVVLGSITNGSAGTKSSVTTSIIDNDLPRAYFPSISQTVTEGVKVDSASGKNVNASSTPVTVDVNLDQACIVDTVIPYTVGGDATKPGTTGVADHSLVDGTLTIPAGGQSGKITFDVNNDSIIEKAESVTITLNSSSSANVGADNIYTLTINNNTAPTANPVTIKDTTGNVPTVTGDVLSGTYKYNDAEGDLESTTGSLYQWLRNGFVISGATNKDYTLTLADSGAKITLQVTPIAATGTLKGTPATSSAIKVDNAPQAKNVGITYTDLVNNPLPLKAGDIVNGVYTYYNAETADTQNRTATSYRWLLDGKPIAGATSPTYTLNGTEIGGKLQFEVTPVAQTGSLVGKPVVSPDGINVGRIGELIGGEPWYVSVQGDFAYVAAKRVFYIIDISDPNHLVQVGHYATHGRAIDVAVNANLAFIVDQGVGLQIVDISDPSRPLLVGSTTSPAYSVLVSGTIAYVAEGSVLQLYDVSTPSKPVPLGSVASSAGHLTKSGNYIYGAADTHGLEIIDVTDPNNPKLVTTFSEVNGSGTPIDYYDVAVHGNYAYVAATFDGVRVVDVSSPTLKTPSLVSSYLLHLAPLPGSYAYSIKVSADGKYAYVIDADRGMYVLDVSTPTKTPVLMGNYTNHSGYATCIDISGNYALMTDETFGLTSLDISNPKQPTKLDNYDTPGRIQNAIANGNFIYTTGMDNGFEVIDFTDPISPMVVNSLGGTDLNSGDIGQGAGAFAQSGNYTLLTSSGMHVLDTTSPSSPQQIINTFQSTSSRGLAISGNYAFVTNNGSVSGLQIDDISDLANSNMNQVALVSNSAIVVAISGSYAFFADGSRVLHVADFSPLLNGTGVPTEVNSLLLSTVTTYARGIAINGNYAYVAYGTDGVHIIDISTPATANTLIDKATIFTTPDVANNVAVNNNKLYIALQDGGLEVMDLAADPIAPVEVGYVHTPGYGVNVNVDGSSGNIYFSDDYAGLEVYQYQGP